MNQTSKARGAAMAAQFRANAEKALNEKWTKEVTLPIPSISPDFQFTFIAQRVDLTSLLYAGQLPEAFAKQILANKRELSQEEAADDFLNNTTADEKKASLEFQVKIVQEVCLAPKLVFRDPESDDEVDLRALPFSGNLIIALFNYAMGLSPDVPVQMTDGGETTVKAVETFPDGTSGPELPGTGNSVPNVRAVAGGETQNRG